MAQTQSVLWDTVTLSFAIGYNQPGRCPDQPLASNHDIQLAKLRHYAHLSRDKLLTLRLVIPTLPVAATALLGDYAPRVLSYSLDMILRQLSTFAERIRTITIIATTGESMNMLSYILNNPSNPSHYYPTSLFLHTPTVHFVQVKKSSSQKTPHPLVPPLPCAENSKTNLVLIRPLHQWWRGLIGDPLTPRITGLTSLVFHRPRFCHVTENTEYYLLTLLFEASDTLRHFDLLDVYDHDPALLDITDRERVFPPEGWQCISLKLELFRVTSSKSVSWINFILWHLDVKFKRLELERNGVKIVEVREHFD